MIFKNSHSVYTLADLSRHSVMNNYQNGNGVAKSPPNFGSATFILTRFMKQQTLMYQSTSRTDVYFLFRKKTQKRLRNGTVSMYFECQTCLDANDPFDRSKPCRVTVNEGLIVTDPDVGHSPFCAPLSKVQLERLRLDRETRQKCRSLGMAPSVAYREMISQIPERATNIVEQALLATYLPSYQSDFPQIIKPSIFDAQCQLSEGKFAEELPESVYLDELEADLHLERRQ
uniref:Uncharacterized protein n=1 Tax=Romanomermis culicivorax TaxID=13658 RepID=A0A915K6I1_ROMCU